MDVWASDELTVVLPAGFTHPVGVAAVPTDPLVQNRRTTSFSAGVQLANVTEGLREVDVCDEPVAATETATAYTTVITMSLIRL